MFVVSLSIFSIQVGTRIGARCCPEYTVLVTQPDTLFSVEYKYRATFIPARENHSRGHTAVVLMERCSLYTNKILLNLTSWVHMCGFYRPAFFMYMWSSN